jgi:hypothetical protein
MASQTRKPSPSTCSKSFDRSLIFAMSTVSSRREAGRSAVASADPGPIATYVRCYAKLGPQRARQLASVVMGPGWSLSSGLPTARPGGGDDEERSSTPPGEGTERSARLTIFWHCGPPHFSSRTATGAASRQRTVNGFGRGFALQPGSGNADSQRKVWSSGCSGRCRPYLCYPGCVLAHPPYWRAAASYRPLRAVWAVCAWALRGSRELIRPFSAHENGAPPKRNFQR